MAFSASNDDMFHLLPKQRDLDLTGRKSSFHVNQESLLGKNIGTLFFWGLDKHLWRKHCIFSLLLSCVLELGTHSTTSCKKTKHDQNIDRAIDRLAAGQVATLTQNSTQQLLSCKMWQEKNLRSPSFVFSLNAWTRSSTIHLYDAWTHIL